MLYPLLGGAGSGKTSYIVEQIKELCAKGEQVLLLVPEQFSFGWFTGCQPCGSEKLQPLLP